MTFILMDGAQLEQDATALSRAADELLDLGARTVACCCTPGLGAAGSVALSRVDSVGAGLRQVASAWGSWASDLQSRARAILGDAALPGLATGVAASSGVPTGSAVGDAAAGPGSPGSTTMVVDGDLTIGTPALQPAAAAGLGVSIIGGQSLDGDLYVGGQLVTPGSGGVTTSIIGGGSLADDLVISQPASNTVAGAGLVTTYVGGGAQYGLDVPADPTWVTEYFTNGNYGGLSPVRAAFNSPYSGMALTNGQGLTVDGSLGGNPMNLHASGDLGGNLISLS